MCRDLLPKTSRPIFLKGPRVLGLLLRAHTFQVVVSLSCPVPFNDGAVDDGVQPSLYKAAAGRRDRPWVMPTFLQHHLNVSGVLVEPVVLYGRATFSKRLSGFLEGGNHVPPSISALNAGAQKCQGFLLLF